MGTEEAVFGSHYPSDKNIRAAKAASEPLPEEFHNPQLYFYRIGVGEEKNWLPGEAAAYCIPKSPEQWPAAAAQARAAHPKPEVEIAPPPEGPPPSADQTPLREGETARFQWDVPGAKDVNGYQIYYMVDADKVPGSNATGVSSNFAPYVVPGLYAAMLDVTGSQEFRTACGVKLEEAFPDAAQRKAFVAANEGTEPAWLGALQQLYNGQKPERAFAVVQKGVGGNLVGPDFTLEQLTAAKGVMDSLPR